MSYCNSIDDQFLICYRNCVLSSMGVMMIRMMIDNKRTENHLYFGISHALLHEGQTSGWLNICVTFFLYFSFEYTLSNI